MTPPTDLREVSVANLTIGRMDPVHFIEEAAAAGFGAVGLLLAAATPKPLKHEIVDRPEVIRATKAALQSTGVRVFDVEAFTTGIFFYKEKPTKSSSLTGCHRVGPAVKYSPNYGETTRGV
jgi:hypothetical protein